MVAKKVKNKLEWKLEKGVLKFTEGESCYYVLWEVTRESIVEFVSKIRMIDQSPQVGIYLNKTNGNIGSVTIEEVSIHGMFEGCLMYSDNSYEIYHMPKQFIIDLIGEIK